jgi:hypothetical protein
LFVWRDRERGQTEIHGGEAGASIDEASSGEEPVFAGSIVADMEVAPAGDSVRRGGAEQAGSTDGVPEPPVVRDDAEAGAVEDEFGTSASTTDAAASPSRE